MADNWNLTRIEAQAPTPKAWVEGKKLAGSGAFRDIRPHADIRRGWQASTRGSSGTYTTAVFDHASELGFGCTCPSHQHPCKHALGLAYHLATHSELRPEPEPPPAVAPELDALVRACFANPTHNLPRLVLADYLEERGETDRATVLRIQCALPPPKKGEKPKIKRGAAAPLKQAVQRLSAGLGTFPVNDFALEFRRGFLSLRLHPWVLHQVGDIPDTLARLLRDGWVETVLVVGMTGHEPVDTFPILRNVGTLDFAGSWLHPESLVTLATEFRPGRPDSRVQRILVAPRHRRTLDQLLGQSSGKKAPVQPSQSYSDLTPEKIQLLVGSGVLNGVVNLSLNGGVGADGLRQLAACPALADVRTLVFHEVEVPAEGWLDVWRIPVRQLRELSFSEVPLGDDGVAALGRGTLIPRDELTLRAVGLTAAGVAALAGCAGLQSVRRLDVADNEVGDDGVAALLASPHLSRLESIRGDASVTLAGSLATVFAAPHRANLHIWAESVGVRLSRPATGAATLTATDSQYSRAVLNWPEAGVCPEPLAEFEADGIDLTRTDLQRLRAWFAGRTVPSVALTGCHLRNDDVPELLELVTELKVEKLDLGNNDIGVKGCQALAASPVLAGVRTLYLSRNPIRLNGALALAGSPNRGKLKHFHALGHGFTAAEKKKIAAAFTGVHVTL